MTDEQKKQLEKQLWNIANELRGKMHADEFRDYCLGFIFYKYLSEKMHKYANEILKEDSIDYLSINEKSREGKGMLKAIKEEAVAQLGFFLSPSELFSSLAERASAEPEEFIIGDLANVLSNIEKSTMGSESEDDFIHLFEDLDLTSTKLGKTEKAKNSVICKILKHFQKIDFAISNSGNDVLGDAYEYLIGKFASGAGKKAGEFYTPQQVSTILARIVTTGKEKLKSVYDPTCGSGSLLLRVAREVKSVGDYYGQEMNRTTYNLARMNMILHNVHYRNFSIKQEDTLERPQHLDMKFEAVVANPPFSAKWSANPIHLSDDRFSQYGKLAPASKADFAFIQHMIHHLDEHGVMAVVVPHGVLFRGGAEGHIRKYFIEDRNWLDAVIGLPANIFFGTSIPTCILVFKKCRENPENVLFIDGSQSYQKGKNQNFLSDDDISRIVAAYRKRQHEKKFSACADLALIKENDYSLNLTKYVDVFEEESPVDISHIQKEISSLEKEIEVVRGELVKYLKELDYVC